MGISRDCNLRGLGLDKHLIGLEFLNKLFSSLGEHGGLIHCADEIDLLTIESLRQVEHSGVETVLSKNVLLLVLSTCLQLYRKGRRASWLL